MKTIILYDSQYGNTAKIAASIADTLRKKGDVALFRVGEADPLTLKTVDLLVVGSPTQQFRATEKMRNFLNAIPRGGLQGINVAAFDTRLTEAQIQKTAILAFFVRIYGFAARRIARVLTANGGKLVSEPVGFYVIGMEGPLVEGELERAAAWASRLFA